MTYFTGVVHNVPAICQRGSENIHCCSLRLRVLNLTNSLTQLQHYLGEPIPPQIFLFHLFQKKPLRISAIVLKEPNILAATKPSQYNCLCS